MTRRIELPGGGWADIKDPTELTNRDRKLMRRGMMPAMAISEKLRDRVRGADLDVVRANPTNIPADIAERVGLALNADDMDRMNDAQATCIVTYVKAWSLDGTTPSPALTMDTVDDLPGPVFDVLAAETIKLGDGTPAITPDDALDPASPTVPSTV